MAKRLEREFGIPVELQDGPFGRADICVNGERVAKTGISGWLPRTSIIIEKVKARLQPPAPDARGNI